MKKGGHHGEARGQYLDMRDGLYTVYGSHKSFFKGGLLIFLCSGKRAPGIATIDKTIGRLSLLPRKI